MTTVLRGESHAEAKDDETVIHGAPHPAVHASLEEIVRPHRAKDHGVTLSDGRSVVRLSYPELTQRAAVTAARLSRAGVTPGTPVACVVTNDLASVLTVLGTWMAGGCLVSVPPLRAGRLSQSGGIGAVLATMGCAFFVSDEDADTLPLPPGTQLLHQSALTMPDHGHVSIPDHAIPDRALVQFTSGSIGTPKGVVIDGRTLAGHLHVLGTSSMAMVPGEDRMVSWLPLYHDMGLVAMFLSGLSARIDIVLSTPSTFAGRPSSWLTSLSQERATITAAPNFAYRLAAAVPYEEKLDLSRMRVSLSGGERLQWQSLLDFHRAAGPHGFPWEAIQPSYGLAEGVVGTTTTPVGRGPKLGPGGHVSLGVPLTGVSLKLRTGAEPTPIHLGGASRFAGYQTTDGFQASTGPWHDTGDGGFVHEGELYVIGRRNEVIALAGRNIFAEDVEAVVQDVGNNVVRACAAFRDPGDDTRFGLLVEVERVHTSDAARDDMTALAREIRSCVSRVLGTRLTSVRVVRPRTIPRTTSGKVQRARCRELVENGDVAPRTVAELK